MKFNVIVQTNPLDPLWAKEFGAFLREIKEEGLSTQNECVIECEPEDTDRITAIVKKHHLQVRLIKQQDPQQDNANVRENEM